MKYWKCPNCKKERYYYEEKRVVMKICSSCQVSMELEEDKDGFK